MSNPDPTAPERRATLTYREAAAYLGIGMTSLKSLVAAGSVRHVRPSEHRVLFRVSDLDAYLESVARGGTRRRSAR